MDREIKTSRTADVTITLFDAGNHPVANQEVLIEQTKHQFLFGTAAFDLLS